MKKLALVLLLLYCSAVSKPNPFVAADTLQINGHLAIWLGSGWDWEDGFNYGWFLGHQIKPVFENYVIPSAFGGVAGYNQARQIFDEHFVVDDKYIEIAQGMIDGMEMANIDLFSTVLNDTLTYKDILIANSIPDFTAFSEKWYHNGPGCSNLTSWGDATANAPELLGETVIDRNLDWVNNPYLINNALIVIWVTGDPLKQSFITFGYAGMIGALSGMNESGVATFQNMGNYFSSPAGTGFYPVNLAQRDGLEARDFNNDGICSPRDITDAVRSHNVASTYIVHSAGPSFLEPAAEILEIHNAYGNAIRTKNENPAFFGDNLVATNHFRLLKPPTSCSRYNRISDSLQTSNQLDVNRNWNVLRTAGVNTNLQTIQFIPTQNIIRFSFAETGTPAYMLQPFEVPMDSLFTLFNVGIVENQNEDISTISIFPNPGSRIITIETLSDENLILSVSLRDVNGKLITEINGTPNGFQRYEWDASNVPEGVYFALTESKNTGTGHIKTETKKIVVAR